jgi:hypothetical protein
VTNMNTDDSSAAAQQEAESRSAMLTLTDAAQTLTPEEAGEGLEADPTDGNVEVAQSALQGTVPSLLNRSGCRRLQCLVEKLPACQTDFIAQEIVQSGNQLAWACDGRGHRVIVRLLQRTAQEPWTALLIRKLTNDLHCLCRDRCGRHVAVALLAGTPPRYGCRIRDAFRSDLLSCAAHPVASTVLVALLNLGDIALATALRDESLLGYGPLWRPLLALSADVHGRNVLEAALRCASDLLGRPTVPGRVAPASWKQDHPHLWAALTAPCSLDLVGL